MSEKPIIFSPPMVKAILEGQKTQTRRIIKTPPCQIFTYGDSVSVTKPRKFKDEDARFYPYSPYSVGDILWVREKFCNVNAPEFEPDYYYFADTLLPCCEDYDPSEWTWKPSIHMPRAAARIFLKIKSISVGQVQEITEADAKAEGVEKFNQCKTLYEDRVRNRVIACGGGAYPIVDCVDCEKYKNTSFKNGFMFLWETLNAKRGFSWKSNPWVWVIEFRRIEP